MANPKETLGYPTRTAAVVALRAKRFTLQQIADQIGIKVATVSALEHKYKRKMAEQNRTILFPTSMLEKLEKPAKHRGLSSNQLIREIVEAVVDDGLIDAVLDDGGVAR